jgi:hypothetical protein
MTKTFGRNAAATAFSLFMVAGTCVTSDDAFALTCSASYKCNETGDQNLRCRVRLFYVNHNNMTVSRSRVLKINETIGPISNLYPNSKFAVCVQVTQTYPTARTVPPTGCLLGQNPPVPQNACR